MSSGRWGVVFIVTGNWGASSVGVSDNEERNTHVFLETRIPMHGVEVLSVVPRDDAGLLGLLGGGEHVDSVC